MTDLKITELCAEAMGIYMTDTGYVLIGRIPNHPYDPLHNDTQAMALVKKMALHIVPDDVCWNVSIPDSGITQGDEFKWSESEDLNRAICECVAKMQLAKK